MSPTWLLIRLTLRRWRNRLGFTGPAARRKGGAWIVFGPLLFVASSFLITHQLETLRINSSLESARRVGALLLGLWFFGVLLTEFSNAGLETAAWDLEWLATLPVGIGQIARSRLLTRTLVAPFGWLWLVPFGVAFAWNFGGLRLLAPLAGVLAILPLLFVCAVFLVFAELALHLLLRPAGVRNAKAAASLAAGVVLFTSISPSHFWSDVPRLAGALATVVDWTPFGLVARIFAPDVGEPRALPIAALLAQAGIVFAVGNALLVRMVRSGIVTGGVRTSARGAPAPAYDAVAAAKPPLVASPLLRREFKLLSRDFNYLMQAYLLPIALTVVQLGIHLKIGRGQRPMATLCAWGFGVAAYTYLQSALRTLVLERDSFWVLFTFPRPLSELLSVKARLYACVGLLFALAFLVLGGRSLDDFGWRDVPPLALLVIGAPLFAFVMTAFGALSTRVLDPDAPRHAPASVIYGAMALIGIYAGTIALAGPWQSIGVLVLTLLLALALWQKACDRLPYLLDPDAAIPSRLSLVDGIVALLLFTLLQGAIAALLGLPAGGVGGGVLFMSYAFAAVVACGITELVQRLRGVATPNFLGDAGNGRSLAVGSLLGIGCGLLGLGWQALVVHFGWIDAEELARMRPDFQIAWLAGVAVLLAPPCEEFLFRGLVFEGMRRSFGFGRAALASALLFAILHPIVAFPPVFLLGLATAWACGRSRSLLASVTAHVVYNALVVGGALLATR